MFGFGRRKKNTSSAETAETFVEATGGGWHGPSGSIPADGGSQASFVKLTLERARAYALQNAIHIGEEFDYTITDIPKGISSPHEIVFGLMMKSREYGLDFVCASDERMSLIRLS